MTLREEILKDSGIIEEAKKIILKIDKEIPEKILDKIENTGLKGEELFHLKKTVAMQVKSGISEKDLLELINDYMKLVNQVHKQGKELK